MLQQGYENHREESIPYASEVLQRISKKSKDYVRPISEKAKYLANVINIQNSNHSKTTKTIIISCKHCIDNDGSIPLSDDERTKRLEERHSFPLDSQTSDNTVIDLHDNGSPFIMDWLLFFTNGNLKLTFDRLFNALIDGISKEGQARSELRLKEIIDLLVKTKNDSIKANKNKRMKKLQETCAKLYTKHSFLFEVSNRALRENDRSKITSLGPYCYLVYTYIGSSMSDCTSLRYYLRRQIKSTDSHSMVVYRGDRTTAERIEEYRRGVGVQDKSFKWLSFVSTSFDENVAKSFSYNILYAIELHRDSANDQFVYVGHISYYEDEKEVLLQPGVRFRVNQVEDMVSDEKTNRVKVYITILPSFISKLM